MESTVPKLITLGSVELAETNYNYSGTISSGEVFMWGNNSNGQLGIGGTNVQYLPTKVVAMPELATTISSSLLSACALGATGSVYCWGSNTYGQLGNGSVIQALTPKLVTWL